MQAIVTKYLGPTNHRGSRIKATCWRDSITIPYPHDEHHGEPAHRVAAVALVAKMNAEDAETYVNRMKPGESWKGFSLSGRGGAMPGSHDAYAFIIE